LRARVGIVAELCGKSAARGSLRGGGRPLRARLRTQLLLLGQVTLLRLSLPLKQPLLALQFALRVSSLRSSSLQLLHALLQPIDSTLALGTLP
jgi:hypothetical protein